MKAGTKTALAIATVITGLVAWVVPARAIVDSSNRPPAELSSADAVEDGVIIELTQPPAAVGQVAAAGSAKAQRDRVRHAIVDAENRARQARGLADRAAADIIHQEYGVVLNGFAARLSLKTIQQLKQSSDVRRIVPDRPVRALLEVSVPLIRAPEVWRDLGYRGAGATIAVIDTGVDYRHADLGACLGRNCKVIGGYDFISLDSDPLDDQGHGTHVASIAAGDGPVPGVAPDAKILAYKVLDADGFGSISTVIAGIERAVDPNLDGNFADHATVINMSLGGPGGEDDPVSTAVDNATAAGVLSVVAAGNDGSYYSIGAPGSARTALTVGATDDQDQIAFFSSRGPTRQTSLMKPEIAAPGFEICAAAGGGLFLGPPCRDTTHMSISGTSMATPHVAGAAALLRGFDPSLAPAEAKAILQQSAVPLPFDAVTTGAGRVDVREALAVETVLVPAPINLGVDDGSDSTWSQTAAVTLRNLSASSKRYTLAAEEFPNGVNVVVAPAAVMVGAESSRTISVTVTVDNAVAPDSNVPPFLHRGSLVVSSNSERESVAIAFAKRSPLRNDTCDTATTIAGTPFSDALDTSVASSDPGDPQNSCGCAQNGQTVWYRYTAPANGTLYVDTSGSQYDTVLDVYAGSCGGLIPITCNDDAIGLQSQLAFPVTAGNSYFVQVSSFCSSPAGFMRISVTSNEAAAPHCPGDCDLSGDVTISELVVSVNILLGNLPPQACPECDRNGDGTVSIEELVGAIRALLNGCPA